MSNYRRLISYMYAYEGQVKGKNIGFAKLELRNGQCKIQVSVKKVYESGNDVGVYLLADDTEVFIGKIYIRNGNGEFRTSVYAENVEMSGFSMSKIYGLTIHDMKNPWVSYTTIWEDAVTQAAQVDLEYVTSENCKSEKTEEEKTKEIIQQIEEEVEEQERQKEEQQREEAKEIAKEIEKEIAKEIETTLESPKEENNLDSLKKYSKESLKEYPKEVLKEYSRDISEESLNQSSGQSPRKEAQIFTLQNESPEWELFESREEKINKIQNYAISEMQGETQEKLQEELQEELQEKFQEKFQEKMEMNVENIQEQQEQPLTSVDWEEEEKEGRADVTELEPKKEVLYDEEPSIWAEEQRNRRADWTRDERYRQERGWREERRERPEWREERHEQRPEWREERHEPRPEWREERHEPRPEWREERHEPRPERREEYRRQESGHRQERWECEPQHIRQRMGERGRSRGKNNGIRRQEQRREFYQAALDIFREPESGDTKSAFVEHNGTMEQKTDSDRDIKRSSWLSIPFSPSKQAIHENGTRIHDGSDSGNRESRLSEWTTGLFNKRKGEDTANPNEKMVSQTQDGDLARQVTFQLSDEKERQRQSQSQSQNISGMAESGLQESGYGESESRQSVPKLESSKLESSKLDAPKLVSNMAGEENRKEEKAVISGNASMPFMNLRESQSPNRSVAMPLKFVQDAEKLEKFDKEEQNPFEHSQKLWEELSSIYPKMQEFEYETGCEILAIKPKDIGLLPRENWIYGNNSFLLHGYYNYRYLILVQLTERKGERRYLLGVPGNYYNNDKYMASMFGFSGFVLSKRQPTEDSRFGYWYTNIKMETEEV